MVFLEALAQSSFWKMAMGFRMLLWTLQQFSYSGNRANGRGCDVYNGVIVEMRCLGRGSGLC